MKQYLVAIHPDDYDPSVETKAMSRDNALNDAEILLARSAAPDSISSDATILVLGPPWGANAAHF